MNGGRYENKQKVRPSRKGMRGLHDHILQDWALWQAAVFATCAAILKLQEP